MAVKRRVKGSEGREVRGKVRIRVRVRMERVVYGVLLKGRMNVIGLYQPEKDVEDLSRGRLRVDTLLGVRGERVLGILYQLVGHNGDVMDHILVTTCRDQVHKEG